MEWHVRLLLQSIFLSAIVNLSLGKKCAIDHRTRAQEYEKALHQNLELHDPWFEPPDNCGTTFVNISFSLKYFTLSSEDDLFTLYTWTTLKWVDKRLSWNPSDYGDLTWTVFWSYQYWTPELKVDNKEEDYDIGTYFGQCRLESDGTVTCVPRIIDTVQCLTNITNWPYDTQRCKMQYGLSKLERNVRLKPRLSRAFSMFGGAYGAEWTITGYEQNENISEAIQLEVTFTLERNGDVLGSVVIFPSVLLTVLITSSLFLEVDDNTRLYMTIFATLCHLTFLRVLGVIIPRNGRDIPSVVLFYRFSLIFCLFLVVMTILMIKLRKRVTTPPYWVTKFSSSVLESHGKYIIWPRWPIKVINSVSSADNINEMEVWNNTANILNSFCIFVTILVYSITWSLFIPKAPDFN